ncbi:hypothetical protein Tco_0038860 [Tanacetum coccineum]
MIPHHEGTTNVKKKEKMALNGLLEEFSGWGVKSRLALTRWTVGSVREDSHIHGTSELTNVLAKEIYVALRCDLAK